VVRLDRVRLLCLGAGQAEDHVILADFGTNALDSLQYVVGHVPVAMAVADSGDELREYCLESRGQRRDFISVACPHVEQPVPGVVGAILDIAQQHRPEETTLYQVVQQELETFLTQVEAHTGSGVPEFVKDEFEAFRECGVLAHGFVRLRCAKCAHEKLVAFSIKRRGFCPSCGGRRMAETAAYLVDQVIPLVPVRQWVVSFPIPLRVLFAAHPELLTLVLRIVHRVITRFLLKHLGAFATTAAPCNAFFTHM
jgi:hypothetical protein